MTRLDPSAPVGALFDVLRRRVPATPMAPETRSGGAADTAASGLPALRERLARLLAGIDPDDAEAIASVAPAVLREVLAERVGPGVLALAETPHLLGRLQQELGRERYHSLWRELVVSLNTAPVD